jgi:hypothetical protein
MYQRIVFGELSDFLVGLGGHVYDMTPTELLTLVPLGTLIVLFGIQPGLILTLVQGTVADTLQAVGTGSAIEVGPEVVLLAFAVLGIVLIARLAAALAGSRGGGEAALEGGAAS